MLYIQIRCLYSGGTGWRSRCWNVIYGIILILIDFCLTEWRMPFQLEISVLLEYLEAGFEGYKEHRFRCLKEGEAILNSRHLLCCGIDASNKSQDVVISSLCLQTSNLKAPQHEVHVTLTRSDNIKGARCSCKAGLSGTCKHVAGTLLYINR